MRVSEAAIHELTEAQYCAVRSAQDEAEGLTHCGLRKLEITTITRAKHKGIRTD